MSIEIESPAGLIAFRRIGKTGNPCDRCKIERSPMMEIETETSGGEYGSAFFTICLHCVVSEAC